MFTILRYNKEYDSVWDRFIETSANGTLYQTRLFLSYHGEQKFIDESILLYHDQELACVVPCVKNKETYFSHQGATYGGPVFSPKYYNSRYLPDLVDHIFNHYNYKLELRISNSIYHEKSDSFLLFLLSSKVRMKAEIAWYITTDDDIIESIQNIRNKKNVRNMMKDSSFLCDSFQQEKDYIDFYKILSSTLHDKHSTAPTHTLDEFLYLRQILGSQQKLYLVKQGDLLFGGVYVIKVTKSCWYTFYISKNMEIKKNPSIIYLMYKIQQDAKLENVQYIDYGITSENRGDILNKGLTEFKELSLCGRPSNRYLFLLS